MSTSISTSATHAAANTQAPADQPARAPREIHSMYYTFCRRTWQQLDADQKDYHQKMADVLTALAALRDAIDTADEYEPDDYRPDGRPFKAEGHNMSWREFLRPLLALRYYIALEHDSLEGNCPMAVTFLMADQIDWSEDEAAEREALGHDEDVQAPVVATAAVPEVSLACTGGLHDHCHLTACSCDCHAADASLKVVSA